MFRRRRSGTVKVKDGPFKGQRLMLLRFVPTPAVRRALAEISRRTGLSKTDIVNRSITLQDFLETKQGEGAEFFIVGGRGRPRRVGFGKNGPYLEPRYPAPVVAAYAAVGALVLIKLLRRPKAASS